MHDTGDPILIIEDQDFIRMALRQVLAAIGFRNVKEAATGSAALQVLANQQGGFAVVIADINLPDMTLGPQRLLVGGQLCCNH